MIFEWLETSAAITMAAFVNGVWIGALLAVAVWGLMKLVAGWRPLNATTRFVAWTSVFVMCTGLVIWQGQRAVQYSTPATVSTTTVELPPRLYSHEPPVLETPPVPPVITEEPAQPEPILEAEPVEPVQAPVIVHESIEPSWGESTVPVVEPVIEAGAVFPNKMVFSEARRIEWSAMNSNWRIVLFTTWITISCMLLFRIVIGWYGVWRLKKNSYPAPERVRSALKKLMAQLEAPRSLEVAISDDIQTAVAIGFFNPKILLPASMPRTLTHVELEQVLLHEAAHIQRYDDWTMLFQRIVTALLFFHPGIILLGRLMDRDREFASDDWVVALTKRPKTYASCLAKLVSQQVTPQSALFVPGFSSSKEELFDRVKTILDKKRTISFKLSTRGYAGILAATLLLFVLVIQVAPVIALPAESSIATNIAGLEAPIDDQTDNLEDFPVDEALPANDTQVEVLAHQDLVDQDEPVFPETLEEDLPVNSQDPEIEPSIEEALAEPNGFALRYSGTIEGISTFEYATTYASDVSATALPRPASATPSEPIRETSSAAIVAPAAKDTALSSKSRVRILSSVVRIPSSADKAQLLIKAAQKMSFDEDIFEAFLNAASTVASSGDRTRTLMALTDHQQLDENAAVLFLESVSQIPSSGDKTRVLLNSLNEKALPLSSEKVQSAFLDSIETIHSSSEFRRVMKAFLDSTN